MLVISCFELVLGYSYIDVFPHCVGLRDGGLVDDSFLETIASKYADISEYQIHLITHKKKIMLYKDGNPWEKTTSAFDVTMESYDGAEICELVGLYLLSQLQNLNINVGLYRDDGLAVTNQTPRKAKMTKKKLCKIFKDNNLRIAVEAKKKVTDFLDITLDLHTGSYKPYKKPNDTISYIRCQSNHPPSIIKNLPKVIEIRLSNNSANADIFQEAAKPYNNVLKNNGHKEELKYTIKGTIQNKRGERPNDSNPKESEALTNNTKENNNKKRRRKITWFNPPFSTNVATNIGKKFLTLLSACFPANNKLHKIINKNTIKLSYSCMGNIKQSIANHNKAILSKEKIKEEQIKLSNCRNRTLCPLQGNCLQKGVVYQATVTQTNRMREDKLQTAMHQAAVHQAAVHQDLLKRTDENVQPQHACRGNNVRRSIYKCDQTTCMFLLFRFNMDLYVYD